MKNPELELALKFIEKTDRNIFLTGKAGTGKTTFLQKVKKETLKRMIVVAPTGVAAINAKGTTIHSFFQMPFGPILPNSISNNTTVQRKFTRKKIDIIRSLDLVVIDEISMVRADILDGIDQVLRRYKDKSRVFGGVQMLMIGDLQQLSPVVKPNEWNLLRDYYETVYFFSSKAFKMSNVVSIELKHIYRQDNEAFIAILNEVRSDRLSNTSRKILNERYNPDFVPRESDGYITLTTHNGRADNINKIALNKLKGKLHTFKAEVSGVFQEHSYPTAASLVLAKGAQVMFIKNDSSPEKRFFNGKIGRITYVDKDEIIVKCSGDSYEITIEKETWENVNYAIDEETKDITENVLGSFTQMPLRLAWAITIHKSQGLTFEKAIIDAEASFAHGQTYVALSRCKTLEGIVLKTPIDNKSIITDGTVVSFTQNVSENLPNKLVLDASEKRYHLNLMDEIFNFHPFLAPLNRLISIYNGYKSSFKGTIIAPLELIKEKGVVPLIKVSHSFKKELIRLSEGIINLENDSTIQDRFKSAVTYFQEEFSNYIVNPVTSITFFVENKSVKQDFEKQLAALDQIILVKKYCLNALKNGFSAKDYLKVRAKAAFEIPAKKLRNTPLKEADLIEGLKAIREEFSDAENVHPFQIFTQESLFQMVDRQPTNIQELKAIKGMGKIRIRKYGSAILQVILNYCENEQQLQAGYLRSEFQFGEGKIDSKQVSLNYLREGLSIDQIAEKRGLAKGTIEEHLVFFIASEEITILEVMSEKRYKRLKKAIEKVTFENLSDLKRKMAKSFSYGELKMMIAALKL
ncbi:helix-turn-helix domain-containing protein [Tenacibaculum maritimum]|uniref:helix-turn-helix domain-containing protein n=1 Tax=Tenacibaculum maritimum TaxID=107401 RepID=UPI0012E4C6F0|nr:helix-turn-helix domain-containing protein [Tenacibaculum maritimum]MCD9582359.1 helix-turn-helix domain-containing protein [Tenacibaculum maritimum]MCD9636774.1 helix-turn-helix domain-containing protein [Tenacibaculum maritimum]CAA0214855.1 putative helicase [Tenacibaculum maritimum]CAA0217215.1 putative helicase [Tenacibaculum maritimum]